MDGDDYSPTYRAFVKHPPRKDLTEEEAADLRLCVHPKEAFQGATHTETGEDASGLASLLTLGQLLRFEETGDPILALKVFRACHGSGVYPPLSVMDWLDKSLERYFEAEGAEDLEKLLGLKGGRGNRNPFTAHDLRGEDRYRADIVHLLVTQFGVAVEKAAEMLHVREDRQGHNPPSPEWIAERYWKHWRPILARDNSTWWDMNEEERRAFLDSFPDYPGKPSGLK